MHSKASISMQCGTARASCKYGRQHADTSLIRVARPQRYSLGLGILVLCECAVPLQGISLTMTNFAVRNLVRCQWTMADRKQQRPGPLTCLSCTVNITFIEPRTAHTRYLLNWPCYAIQPQRWPQLVALQSNCILFTMLNTFEMRCPATPTILQQTCMHVYAGTNRHYSPVILSSLV